MGVVSHKELPRKNTYEIGKPRVLVREFVVVLSDDTLTGNPTDEGELFTGIGVDIGYLHPTYANYRVRKMTYTEGHDGSPYHVHVSCEYGLIAANELVAPTAREAVWEFDSQPSEVPALFYYGDGDTRLPLTNSAYDFFPGMMTFETVVVIKITKNFATFPSQWVQAQNHVNSDGFLGCPADSVRVEKVNVKRAQEDGSWGPVAFWEATAELHYRQSGHSLLLPDIGWNMIVGGQKQRATVFDFENGQWVPSANPIALNGAGGLAVGEPPAILTRRINPRANFFSLFGNAPTTPLPI